MSLVNGGRLMADIDPSCKESAHGGEELLLLVVGLFFTGGEKLISAVDGGVGLFFTGGEMTMSDVVSLMMVDVGGILVSVLVVHRGG
nr:hypothetical protein CFP56_39558 [Quercus suber]